MQAMHTEFTDKEVQHTLHRRTTWHKVMRRTGAILLIVYGVFICAQLMRQLAYHNVMNAIPASTHVGGPPVFTIMVGKYAQASGVMFGQTEESRLVAEYMNLYQQALDSLGLTSKVLGFNLGIMVVPFHSTGQRHSASRMVVYSTDCGCEKDNLDQTVLEIDTSGTHVEAISSHKVASASIQP